MKFMNKDRALSILLLAISIFFYFNVQTLKSTGFEGDPGPKMFPYLGIFVLIVCAVILFIKPDKTEGKPPVLLPEQMKQAIKLLTVYGLIFVLLLVVGYVIAAPVILFVLCFMFSKVSNPDIPVKKNAIRSIVYAFLISAGLYLVYVTALGTQLPKGLLWIALLG